MSKSLTGFSGSKAPFGSWKWEKLWYCKTVAVDGTSYAQYLLVTFSRTGFITLGIGGWRLDIFWEKPDCLNNLALKIGSVSWFYQGTL